MMRLALHAGLALLFAISAAAQSSDAVLAGESGFCVPVTPALTTLTEWIGAAPEVEQNEIYAIAPAPGGQLIGLRGLAVVRFVRGQEPVTIVEAPASPIALVADRAGNVHVLVQLENVFSVVSYEPDGTLISTHVLGTGYDSAPLLSIAPMDLGADQCTLFVVHGNTTIRRFDLCTGAFLPDFATGTEVTALRVLPDGGLLVSDGEELKRFDAAGTLVRTYTVIDERLTSLGLANNGRTAWATTYGCAGVPSSHPHALQIDLRNDTVLSDTETHIEQARTITAANAWTAAIGAAAAATIPTLSETMLLVLVALVAVIAVRRLVS